MRALVALLLASLACGPIKSTSLIIEADEEIGAARLAGADKIAPYEFISAETYLHQARVEIGHSNYQAGLEYAAKAKDLAREAHKKAGPDSKTRETR